jgi:hypothetical protein
MEYWLKILKKEESKIRDYEDTLKDKNDPKLKSRIQDLDTTDLGIKSILDSKNHFYYVNDLLGNPSIFNVVAESVSSYTRALFSINNRLDKSLIGAIMHLIEGKYQDVGLVAHYRGRLFNPKNIDFWNEIKEIDKNKKIAFYAYKPDDFIKAKAAVDVMGGVIGDELEIPFLDTAETIEPAYAGDPNSQVERLASSEYKLHIKPKDIITLDAGSIDAISDRATIPNPNQLNRGSVNLLYSNRRYNVKDISIICQLNGKKFSELSFTFRGGYPKEAAYALLDYFHPSKSDI